MTRRPACARAGRRAGLGRGRPFPLARPLVSARSRWPWSSPTGAGLLVQPRRPRQRRSRIQAAGRDRKFHHSSRGPIFVPARQADLFRQLLSARPRRPAQKVALRRDQLRAASGRFPLLSVLLPRRPRVRARARNPRDRAAPDHAGLLEATRIAPSRRGRALHRRRHGPEPARGHRQSRPPRAATGRAPTPSASTRQLARQRPARSGRRGRGREVPIAGRAGTIEEMYLPLAQSPWPVHDRPRTAPTPTRGRWWPPSAGSWPASIPTSRSRSQSLDEIVERVRGPPQLVERVVAVFAVLGSCSRQSGSTA